MEAHREAAPCGAEKHPDAMRLRTLTSHHGVGRREGGRESNPYSDLRGSQGRIAAAPFGESNFFSICSIGRSAQFVKNDTRAAAHVELLEK